MYHTHVNVSPLKNRHNVWVRLNAVVFFGLTVLLCLSGLAWISKLGHSLSAANKPGMLCLTSVQVCQ